MAPNVKRENEANLLRKARDKFTALFGREPVAAATAPSRVNLIGDHIDYNEGFVLPAALHYCTIVVGGYNGTSSSTVLSLTESGQEWETTFSLPVSKDAKQPKSSWANYVLGVVYNFPGDVQAFDAVIVSDVPMGSGVSSSAALEVATFTFLEALTGEKVDPVAKALACQKAEHEFAGMPCGIMDQFISTMAKEGFALLIDCRSLGATHIPLRSEDVVILVTNSNVKHQLTGSEYPQRRAQCQLAADLLGYQTLRSAKIEDLDELKLRHVEAVVIQRAKHVITEITRTEQAAKCLQDGDFETVGKLFYESHESLSTLMEVSCPELDQLVEVSRSVPGVLGSRMTGGGFGGCIVSLVRKQNVEDLKKAIQIQYKGNPTFFLCQPSNGARILNIN